ncbi:helix-turn-helix domain-containing protein [Saccharopolyspora cebuensis]|uniref:Helix-turn-helix domain-containing protein n=1 Tax=Saccharopolyspora cebuensis TaxID=418759 RepID=A0ABV4CH25_9PSEU
MKIAALRRSRGWSQQRLIVALERQAETDGTPLSLTRASLRTSLSRWENGHHVPDPRMRALLCSVLRCSERELGLDESANPSVEHEPAPPAAHAGATTPETLTIFEEMLTSYARLDALVGPGAAIGSVREGVRTLDGMLRRASSELRPRVAATTARYVELAGWLAQDAGDRAAAASWSARATDLATLAGDPHLASYVWMRRSSASTDSGLDDDGLLFAEVARTQAVTSDLRALAWRQQAYAHALAGRQREAAAAIAAALDHVASGGDLSGLAPYCGVPYVLSETAASWIVLGRPDRAVHALEEALPAWPAEQGRDRAIGLARLARAQLLGGDLDAAVARGSEAVLAIRSARSARALAEIDRLRDALQKQSTGAARVLVDQIRCTLHS